MTTSKKAALDSNVVLFLHDKELTPKRAIAQELTASTACISTQVISEYLNVCHKKFKMPKTDALEALIQWLPHCQMLNVNEGTYLKAYSLVKRYDFQLFDSIVVAAALEANCDVLYSEDMHHNLLVEKQLVIINPFI